MLKLLFISKYVKNSYPDVDRYSDIIWASFFIEFKNKNFSFIIINALILLISDYNTNENQRSVVICCIIK